MPKYKLSSDKGVYSDDGLFIPEDGRNRHWNEYQEWLQQGNTPDPPSVEPTPEPLENVLILGIKSMSTEDKVKFFEFLQEGLKNGT